jgi:hypothetical protein
MMVVFGLISFQTTVFGRGAAEGTIFTYISTVRCFCTKDGTDVLPVQGGTGAIKCESPCFGRGIHDNNTGCEALAANKKCNHNQKEPAENHCGSNYAGVCAKEGGILSAQYVSSCTGEDVKCFTD